MPCNCPPTGGGTGIQTARVSTCSEGVAVDLAGTLIFDDSRLSHVHARFPGEIVSWSSDVPGSSVGMGRGCAGQLLAVLWSHDLGEKKSESGRRPVAIARGSRVACTPQASGGRRGHPRTLAPRMPQRKVEGDEIAVARVVRTLETWCVPAEEIEALRTEARRLAEQDPAVRGETTQRRARLEIRSPVDGVILERNAAIGDLVDTSVDLFKIGDLSRLKVVANAYEEDLPVLDDLPPAARRWFVQVASDSAERGQAGNFDQISHIIDPNQHTALVMGWVDNAAGRLRAWAIRHGRRIELPASPREVVIPATALVEEGNRSIVFVNIAANSPRFERRLVSTSRRDGDRVFVRSVLTAELKNSGCQPLCRRAGGLFRGRAIAGHVGESEVAPPVN